MPSRRKFMNILDDKNINMISLLKSILKEQANICVTCDVWSCRAQSYLGMTAHYIVKNFKRESVIIAFKQLHCRETYDYLAHQIDGIFKDLELNVEKITHIVTDGGNAFCKMFKVFGSENDTIVQNTLESKFDSEDENVPPTVAAGAGNSSNQNKDESLDSVEPFMSNNEGELFESEILDFSYETNSAIDDYLTKSVTSVHRPLKLPSQRRCYSHHLNLAPKDFKKEILPNAERAFACAYNKLHALWCLTNRSSRAKTICKGLLGIVLNTPCETRWNSEYDCVNKVTRAF